MDRARELFERLEGGGLVALEQMLADVEPESLFLDFKRAVTAAGDASLHRNDRENLSRALSGFANSEGGLLLWGVNARRDAGTQREIAEKAPVGDALGFRTLIEAALSGESIPSLPNVRVLHVLEGVGPDGYVAVHIPASLIGPIRATRGHLYQFRAGSSFGIVPHAVLAGMFGRPPQPVLQPNLLSYFTQLTERGDGISAGFGVAVGNFGAVLASKVFLSGWMDFASHNPVTVQLIHGEAYSLRRGRLPGFSIVAKEGVELAPGAQDELCNISLTVPIEYKRPIQFEFTFGARDTAPVRFFVGFSAATMQGLAERLRTGRIATSDVWDTDAATH